MPTTSQHQTKAESNRTFLGSFAPDAYPDWAAVVAFYTAVHLIERLRALDGQHSENHVDRLRYVQFCHRTVHHEFRELLNLSKLARYEANAVFYGQISNEDVRDVVVNGWLAAVETYVTGFVAARVSPPPAPPS